MAGRGYNLLLVSRKKEGLVRAAEELREASRLVCTPFRGLGTLCHMKPFDAVVL